MMNPMTPTNDVRLIESDSFAFEFLSKLAERESWRKEIHRPIYHVHKWWAQRLGSVFRGILLGGVLPDDADLGESFYLEHSFGNITIFDPFMGSGTTIGEAHKLGMTALGRDINPVAVRAVKTALGPLDRRAILTAFEEVSSRVEHRIRSLYRSLDARGYACEVLYYFWVMQAQCPGCASSVDLFPSHVVARNAHPDRKAHVQVRCPSCSNIFGITHAPENVKCPKCLHRFDATAGTASGTKATCSNCRLTFTILDAIGPIRPTFRLFGKLVLCGNARKEYLAAIDTDLSSYEQCGHLLRSEVEGGRLTLPSLRLTLGHNTRQAMNYNFLRWIDFFNDRQLLALAWLRGAISELADSSSREALLTLFSGTLEFNNMFASYKGEGTGAVRHMFSHHILKPERTPIEANVWGTSKSSGGFSNLLRSRLLRAIDYRDVPTEVHGSKSAPKACSRPFSGKIEPTWPVSEPLPQGAIYLSTGNSARSSLPEKSVDIVATDPPFFDNVHYSELADFFQAWQQIGEHGPASISTRQVEEVQDVNAAMFAGKLRAVFAECRRVLRDNGLLIFTYHHSRAEGWQSLAQAIWGAGFRIVNAHPVKAEMSVATPKFQTKEPIQLDIILICRKQEFMPKMTAGCSRTDALDRASAKLRRLAKAGFTLSRSDRRITLIAQLLAALNPNDPLDEIIALVEQILDDDSFDLTPVKKIAAQLSLFET